MKKSGMTLPRGALADVIAGSLAGAAATWALGRVTNFLYERAFARSLAFGAAFWAVLGAGALRRKG